MIYIEGNALTIKALQLSGFSTYFSALKHIPHQLILHKAPFMTHAMIQQLAHV